MWRERLLASKLKKNVNRRKQQNRTASSQLATFGDLLQEKSVSRTVSQCPLVMGSQIKHFKL